MAGSWAEDVGLLVRLVRRDHEGAARCVRARRAPLYAFFEFAAAHRLSLVVLGALGDSPLRDTVPAPRIAALERQRVAQAARTRRILEELQRLAACFTAAGQPFLLLKGPYLAQRFYGDVYGREFVDLDLLVPGRDRARAFRLLVEAGYARRSRTILGVGLTCFFVHGFDFTNGSTTVDLHWCLSRHPSYRIDEGAIWARRQTYHLGGHPYHVLPDEHEVVFAALSLLRDFERGRPKIKNVVDLLRIVDVLDERLDWESFLEARRAEGTLGPTINVLGLCLDVAGAHDLFPRLDSALGRHAGRRVPVRFAAAPLLLAPAGLGLGNKLWSARVHDTSSAMWLLWWAVSMPFRVAVHRLKRRRSRRDARRRVAPILDPLDDDATRRSRPHA